MSPSQVQPSSRRGAFLPLDGVGRVEAVERQLGEAIYEGALSDGEQLPSELELAQQLGVSTMTLREALVGLRRAGLVSTRRGRGGGTFVRISDEATSRYLGERLRALGADELRDLGDHHMAIAASAAELAAARASDADLDPLRHHMDALSRARTSAECDAADRRFHVELAAAARSTRLVRATRSVQGEIGPLLWHAAPERVSASLEEHRAILAAVIDRDALRARQLCVAHVESETVALLAACQRVAGARADGGTADGPGGAGDVGRRGTASDPAERRAASEAVLSTLRATLESVFAGLERLRAAVVDLAATAAPLRRRSLGALTELIVGQLLSGAGPLIGTGVVFAPGVLADAPRWMEWRWMPVGRDPVALDVSLDPDDVHFYDYEDAEWFAVPRATGQRWIAGPFVDYSCTDRHTLTLTLPVSARGHFLGIAGADVTVAQIEQLALPLLRAVPAPAALLNRRGRVIASSGARWIPGTLAGEAGALAARASLTADGWTVAHEGATALWDDALQWAVVTGRDEEPVAFPQDHHPNTRKDP